MANVPAVSMPSLSDLLTVRTETVVHRNNQMFQQFLLSRRNAVVALMQAVREQNQAVDVAFAMHAGQGICDDVFLMSINTYFAVVAGFRSFLINAVEYILQADGAEASEEARSILLLAEGELENEMKRVLERVQEAATATPYNLHWEEGKGLFFHKVNLALPGFGAW